MTKADPFRAQRTAFDEVAAGRWRFAASGFALALRGFDALLTDRDAPNLLQARAARNPEARERASEVVRKFLEMLPGWLRDMHLERFNDAIWRNQSLMASLHWQALLVAAQQPTLGLSIDLRNLRDIICHRFDLTHERMVDGGEKTAEGLRLAERVLSADPDNTSVRYRVIEGYTWQVGSALNKILPRSRSNLPDIRVTAGQKRRLEISLRRLTRRLRAHLSRASRDHDINASTTLAGYQQLGRYYASVGDVGGAIRMARRARRLVPGDPDLARWMRTLRRLGRSE